VPVTGDVKFIARLRKAASVGRAMDTWAMEGAEVIAQEARDLVDEGGFPRPNHIVSEPGQAPNTDTGNLVAHTNAEDLPEVGQAAVISDAEYSRVLEFGGRNVYERPFMRPATANKRRLVVQLAKVAVNKTTKGSRKDRSRILANP